ncbi:MAG: hypothetical protein PUA56_01580 [Bacillales bacterium]|nr:hypothetical protein [Bacillales bacterium]
MKIFNKLFSLIVCLLLISCQFQKNIVISSIKDNNQYYLKFDYLTDKDNHVLSLKENDHIKVEYQIEDGEVDILIGMENEEYLYKGNKIDKGDFILVTSKEGMYNIKIEYKEAKGEIKIFNKGEIYA